MPVYEYECEACGGRFERLVRSMNQDPPGLACPACQGTEVRRLISAPAVHSGGESGGSGGGEESSAPKPPVFGRKELNKALKSKS
jgi:putative FmdB family regulatory protein